MGKECLENFDNLSDDSIVALVKSGDYEPVGILIKRYYPTILLYVNQLCPEEQREDAIQEATFALYSAIKGYDSQKSSFSTFASVCIKRAVISFLRSLNRKRVIPSELVSSFVEVEIVDSNSPEKIFFDRDNLESLTNNIKLELSPLEYKVLELYVSGYRYSVFADRLSITEKSVNNAMLRIRKKLKQE